MRRSIAVAFGALALLLAFCTQAFALNPAFDVSQYAHTAWRLREGFAKGIINSIAQTPDGYLWFATEFGLLRFDGVRTVAWQPPAGQRLPATEILGLLVARDGSMWIGTAKGLAILKDGALTELPQVSGHYVYAMIEDREGTTWVGTISYRDAKVCAVNRSGVECHGGAGRFGNTVLSLHEDSQGRIWAGVVEGAWRLKPGPAAFFAMPGEADMLQSFVEYEGMTLISSSDGVRRFIDGKIEPYRLKGVRGFRAQRFLHDRDGGLWIGTMNHGIVHLHQGRADTFTLANGLSGDAVYGFYEDREGSVWVATVNGLDRFRDVVVSSHSGSQGVTSSTVTSVVSTSDGTLWFGANGVLNRWHGSDRTVVPPEPHLSRSYRTPNSLFEDRRGRFWVSTLRGIGHVDDGKFERVAGIPGGSAVHAIADDTDGNVWIASQDLGLFRLGSDGAIAMTAWMRLVSNDFASAMVADPVKGIWIGFNGGGLIHLIGDEIRESYSAANGLGEGRINTLRFDAEGVLWAATSGGLSRLRGGKLATLNSKRGLPCDSVHWAIEGDAQSVWLYMSCALVRVAAGELQAWSARANQDGDDTRVLPKAVFDSSSGVQTRMYAGGYQPQVTKSVDGEIWYVSLEGLSVLDPRRIPFNALPPPVHIERITVDRKALDTAVLAGEVRLPALTRDLQIDYTALSLSAPEKMQFRYLLEGYDREWQDVGNRRQAFYTNLAPRSYRFRVIAANNDGVWNETGATVSFVVVPAYYQTPWFLALSTVVAVALGWVAHRIRLRIVEKHQHEITALNERLMGAQEQERIRLAGELHDGVMQEMLAVTMMLGAAKRRMPGDSETRATIDKVQDKLVQVGKDLRQLSHDLHPPALQEMGLPQALRTHCDQFSGMCGVPVSCVADDTTADLSRGAALALFRIVQEALGNAAKHAQASEISVHLKRAKDIVALTVSDNGVGFDRTMLTQSGGLGLITMRERATQLNGRFEFDSVPGRGTTIVVTIPYR